MKKNFKGYLLAAGLITAAIAAAITVSCLGKHGVYGDVNSDNSVDSRDLVRLMKYIAANGDGIEAHGADLNGDGIVDTRDLIRLMSRARSLRTMCCPRIPTAIPASIPR